MDREGLFTGTSQQRRADINKAHQYLKTFPAKGGTVIADRGYDANHLREWPNEAKATAASCRARTERFCSNTTPTSTRPATSSSAWSIALRTGAKSACEAFVARKQSSPLPTSPRSSCGAYEPAPYARCWRRQDKIRGAETQALDSRFGMTDWRAVQRSSVGLAAPHLWSVGGVKMLAHSLTILQTNLWPTRKNTTVTIFSEIPWLPRVRFVLLNPAR